MDSGAIRPYSGVQPSWAFKLHAVDYTHVITLTRFAVYRLADRGATRHRYRVDGVRAASGSRHVRPNI